MKKVVKVTPGGARTHSVIETVPDNEFEAIVQEQEIILDSGDEDESDEDNIAAVEEMIVETEEMKDSDGKELHDNTVVKTLRDQAIHIMATRKDDSVKIAEEEQAMAFQLFPKVSTCQSFIYGIF
jgi:hypothetical protein